jgi:hypothetical protein
MTKKEIIEGYIEGMDRFTVHLPNNFRGKIWSEQFGAIQKAMRFGVYKKQTFTKILIDMQNCIWADPLPMLSLCISLIEAGDYSSSRVILFPSVDVVSNEENPKSAFVAFMVQEGFLDIFITYGIDVFFGDKSVKSRSPFEMENPALLNYNDCHVLPARIETFILPAEDDDEYDTIVEQKTQTYVRRIYDEQLEFIKTKTPNDALGNMCTKIYQILFEAVNNVIRHSGVPHKCVGIYIRYRLGLRDLSLSSNQIQSINLLKKAEEEYNPMLSAEMVDSSDGFFEVFVIDSGVGIRGSLVEDPTVDKSDLGFRDYFQDVFFRKRRRHSSMINKLTADGGLDLIAQFLKDQKDYIFSHEGYEWIGFNSSSGIIDTNNRFRRLEGYGEPVKGLAWLFRLAWKKDDARGISGVAFYQDSVSKHPVYKALFHEKKAIYDDYQKAFYVDNRDPAWKGSSFISPEEDLFLAKGKIIHGFPPNYYVWLPNEINSKNEIITSLEKYADIAFFCIMMAQKGVSQIFYHAIEHHYDENQNVEDTFDQWFVNEFKKGKATNEEIFNKITDWNTDKRVLTYANSKLREIVPVQNRSFSKNKTLLMLDVPSYELLIYKNGLDKATIYSESVLELFDKIVIVSKHFEALAFSTRTGSLTIDENIAQAFIEKDYDENSSGRLICMQGSFLWLRWHDSVRFWDTLFSDPENTTYYTNATISWDDKLKEITGYLHMDTIMSHSKLYEYIRLSVERLVGLFPTNNVIFRSNDVLVNQLVYDCNINNYSVAYNSTNVSNVMIDSIYVTGLTSLTMIDDAVEDGVTIKCNVFCHPDMVEEAFDQGRLLLWLKQGLIDKLQKRRTQKYMRIGKTPFIKSIEPLNSNEPAFIINRNQGESIYEKTTSETYDEVQMRGFSTIQIGHFEYDDYHDFFKFNYQSIIDNSKRIKKGMFVYLVKTIFFSLLYNHDPEHVIPMISKTHTDWKQTLKKEYEDGYLSSSNAWKGVRLILYSNHHFTSFLVREIRNVLPSEFSNRFVPLNTSVTQIKNGIVIPPTTIDLIRTKLQELKHLQGNHIMFFDTIISSGRTRKVIKHILLSSILKNDWPSQNGDVKTLSIIDSFRLPYSEPLKDRHHSYWRFDIPRLGSANSCSLCRSVDKASEVASEIHSYDVEKVRDIGFMNKADIKKRIETWVENWKAIPALHNDTDHGIKETIVKGIDATKITKSFKPEINTNVGLALYSNELQSIQIDDSIIIEIIKQIETNYEQKILLIASRLFLYGNWSSKNFHTQMIRVLLDAMSQISTSNYSAFAALALLLQDAKIIRDAVIGVFHQHHELSNDDLKIVLSYISNISKKDGVLYQFLPVNIVFPFDNQERRQAYIGFHNLLYNDAGIIHKNPIEQACGNVISFNSDDSIVILVKANASLSTALKYLLPIDQAEFRKYSGDIVRKKMEDDTNTINDQIKKIMGKCSESEKNSTGKDVQKTMKEVYKVLKDYHGNLFLPFGLKQTSGQLTIKQKIRDIVETNNGQHIVDDTKICGIIVQNKVVALPATDLSEIWYYWNANIETELNYLLANVEHSTGELLSSQYGEKAHMLIEVECGLDECLIMMTNYSKEGAETVYKQLAIKHSHRTEPMKNKNLGIQINCDSTPDGEKFLLKIIMRIPVVKYNS